MTTHTHSTYMGNRTIRDRYGLVSAMPFARCHCGWEGPSRERRSVAVEDGFTHLSQESPVAYDDSGDLVPGWHDSPEGQADAADQARWDRQETRRNG